MHTLAWSKVIFLGCTLCLEQSPLWNQVIQHHLILQILSWNLSFPAVLLIVCVCVCVCVCACVCVCVCVWLNGLLQSMRFLFFYHFQQFFFTYFVSCNIPCAPKEKRHRKEHIISIIIIIPSEFLLWPQFIHLSVITGQNVAAKYWAFFFLLLFV